MDAAKGKTQPTSPFEYAAKLTEVMLLGVVALRAGKKIAYDSANMRVTNVPGCQPIPEPAISPGVVEASAI